VVKRGDNRFLGNGGGHDDKDGIQCGSMKFLVTGRFQSSSSLGAIALHVPWPPVLFASTGLYPELSFSILQSPSPVGPLERSLTI
jgi:hypothetical protein